MKERQIMDLLRSGRVRLPPLALEFTPTEGYDRANAIADVRWGDDRWSFAVEVKARSTPKYLKEAILMAKEASSPPSTLPLLIAPYLRDEQLQSLEKQSVSGVDLNGNGVIVVPGRLLVFRTGNPNRYREQTSLRNVYRGKVSIAARVFLLRARYSTVNEIRDEILSRGTKLAISTVSKVLKALEDDLIVSREQGGIQLRQPQKLLESLAREYEPPQPRRTFVGKVPSDPETLARRFKQTASEAEIRLTATGVSSVSAYAVMAREEVSSFYTSDIESLVDAINAQSPSIEETDRFANIRLTETDDETVYFDVREQNGFTWASPIQTYLELMSGDKRDRETAEQVARAILSEAGITDAP
ncbi:MAG: hypothetical protein BMS9Abin37_2619 [Acidobacteriota bacterium]|nr:MAG: hypothetical protein BMS9Abin37_2619 [Acidobacteriota bacterium]